MLLLSSSVFIDAMGARRYAGLIEATSGAALAAFTLDRTSARTDQEALQLTNAARA
jgi:hypothetical protein